MPEQFSNYVPRLLELVNDLVVSLSPDAKRVLYLNPAAEKIIGRPTAEITGAENAWWNCIHENDRDELVAAVREIKQSISFEHEFRIVQPNGTARYLHGSFRRITSDHTELIAVGCIAKDVTNRKKAEFQLEESTAIYQSLVESLPINVFRKDRDGKIVFVNNRYCETIGKPREELIGRTDFDLFEESLAEKYQKDDRWVLQTGLPFHDIEFHQQEGERFIYVEILKAPVNASNGRRIGIQGMFWDVTDRKKAEIELEKVKDLAVAASQAKSDFLANVSHEIRTPLNAVIGMTDLLLASKVDKSQRDYLKMIQDSGQSLLTIINDILDFSKIESGKLEISSEWFDIRERIGDTLRSLAFRAHKKNVELVMNIDPEIPLSLLGDSQRLRQILVNLVGNSIKFTHQGEIVVHVECVEMESESITLNFQVQDTGIGIPEDKLNKIFEEFVQADTSTTRNYGGTGLGLTITSKLVELMGGKLNVSSKQDVGSSFDFSLQFTIGKQPSFPVVPANFADVPVLIMAANPSHRESIDCILRSWRMQTYLASHLEQAVSLLKGLAFTDQPIQIVFGELSSTTTPSPASDCDCIALAARIQADKEIPNPKIVALNRSSSAESSVDTGNSNIDQILMQPAKYSELRNAITKCLEPVLESETNETADDASFKGPHKILLAEDNLVNQKLATGILSKYGHDVTVVGNGRLAVDALAAHEDFDIVLMDIQMPELDGIKATQEIRASNFRHATIPIIAMTAHAMTSDRKRCLQAGMDEYLSKPFKAADLLATIERVLGQRSKEMAFRANSESSGDVFIDWNQAFETVGGDRKLLIELIRVFVSEKDNMLGELGNCIKLRDCDATIRSAHSLKGTLSHLGASRIAEIARKIEQLEEISWPEASNQFAELQKQIKQLTIELESFTNS